MHGISGGHNRRSKIKYLYFVKVYVAGTTMLLEILNCCISAAFVSPMLLLEWRWHNCTTTSHHVELILVRTASIRLSSSCVSIRSFTRQFASCTSAAYLLLFSNISYDAVFLCYMATNWSLELPQLDLDSCSSWTMVCTNLDHTRRAILCWEQPSSWLEWELWK